MMRGQECTAFVVNLLQDVNVLRPLILLTARYTEFPVLVLVSTGFQTRDRSGTWGLELDRICASIGARSATFSSEFDAYRLLAGKTGLIFAASESSTPAHVTTHNVFRAAPAEFLRVTLQHGYECVGFLHNFEQTAIWGDNVVFAADVLCGWADGSRLRSLGYSERQKLVVTGPSARIPIPNANRGQRADRGQGLVCENLHSVRLNFANLKGAFMRDFFGFCARLESDDQHVALRPHPGGQYTLRNKIALPTNVELENRPMYQVDLSEYDFGISAPSSVLIDMLFADIPTAVWHDADDLIDTSNYRGLARVSTAEEWMRFAAAAQVNRSALIEQQHVFLQGTGMQVEPDVIERRFGALLARSQGSISVSAKPTRILLLANAAIPTLDIYFLKPLKGEIESGRIRTYLVTEAQINQRFKEPESADASRWLVEQMRLFGPDVVISCRYSGPHSEAVIDVCEQLQIPLIFHIDDDLLGVPIELGERKFRFHNLPSRLESVRTQLRGADVVYCATTELADRVDALGYGRPTLVGAICHAPRHLIPAERRPVRVIGYMGYDHMHDLIMILPVIVAVLDRFTDVVFHLFGGMDLPEDLYRFGERVLSSPPIGDYESFQYVFETIGWDIGICPLADTPFNRAKTPIKWHDYTAAGIAVLASSGTIYDEICSDGCGLLAGSQAEWVEGITALIEQPDLRYEQVKQAQSKMRKTCAPPALARQVLDVIGHAVALRKARIMT